MTATVIVVLVVAGISEALGRVVPLIARRSGIARPVVIGLILTGGLIEAAVFALWPLTSWTLAELLLPAAPAGPEPPSWTPELAAPLMLAAVLAFPLLGPLLHLLLMTVVGVGLTGPLAAATGLGWWTTAACVAGAGLGLGLTIDVVRRVAVRVATR
ncbi:hypothetical protein M1L60_14750 [Actinoplanes sp. TRM 88003]|uniref:Integral membrane protein n=1 Tax=Paractinoplanes aksuensis TaxID=2939490 RepID=A0ABT1DP96_9ACTN|nr:hypothetical protein [Actinoplanes aksuensis]MCO8271855.1 hypothetical protein [Actinoplanes aksuensis]